MKKLMAVSVSSQIAAEINRLSEQMRRDPEFAKWLVEEYKPIAGGWQY